MTVSSSDNQSIETSRGHDIEVARFFDVFCEQLEDRNGSAAFMTGVSRHRP
jgi:hypothetical protein